MGILVANPGFETVDVSTDPGAYRATGAGADLTLGGWVFEQTAVNYADTVNDFGTAQGEKDWYYGYSTDPGIRAAFSTNHMIPPTVFGSLGETWTSDGFFPANTPWHNVAGSHPPATGHPASAVKRWIADVTDNMWIVGYSKDEGDSADGLIFWIRRNGLILYERLIPPGDAIPQKFSINTTVAEGDAIDFVVFTRSVDDGTTTIYTGDYLFYRASIFSGSQSGIVNASSSFAPAGASGQLAMIQGTGRFYQDLIGPHSALKVKFSASAAMSFPLQIVLNGEVVDEITIDDPAMTVYESVAFDFPVGTNRLAFQGMGSDDDFLYIDDVSTSGAYYVDGVEESDSGETLVAGSRGRSQGDLSSSFEIACRTIIYSRGESDSSASAENKALSLGNPYISLPTDGTIGTYPGIGGTISFYENRSEIGRSEESFKLMLNGAEISIDPCVVLNDSTLMTEGDSLLLTEDESYITV